MSTGPSARVRRMVFDRDGGCVICGAPEVQAHHRRPRGMGGSSLPDTNLPGNLVCLCPPHHAAVESYREVARDLGLLVPQGVVSALVPVWCWRGWVLLDDFGGWGLCPDLSYPMVVL